jgi:hypothetical protein
MRSVGKILKVAAVTGGLLVFACPQARSASADPKVYTESWQDKESCTKVGGSTSCDLVSAGSFTITATLPQTTTTGSISPSALLGATVNISLATAGSGSGTATSTSGASRRNSKHPAHKKAVREGTSTTSSTSAPTELGFFYTGTVEPKNGWAVIERSGKSTARLVKTGPNCGNPNVKYGEIVLTVTAGWVKVAVTGRTGSNSCGNEFLNPVYAESFVGHKAGPVSEPNALALDVGVGTFAYNAGGVDDVSVTGKVKTKKGKEKIGTGSSAAYPELYDVSLTGTL